MGKRGRPSKVGRNVDITEELLKIHTKYGSLTPENVLKEAKKKRHPLHPHFDWDDTEAANRWRVHQSNMLISQARITITEHEEKKIHAFVSISKEGKREFVYTADALEDKQILFQIFSQLKSRIENIQDQLESMHMLKGAVKSALIAAKKPISKQTEKLKKTG